MFTAENARELARKSVLKRQQNLLELKLQAAKPAEVLLMHSSPGCSSVEPFQVDTLSRARKQIAELQTAIDESLEKRDWKASKALADALKALCEIERQLAGRSLPPTQRPITKSDKRRPSLPEPTEAQPSQAMPSVPVQPAQPDPPYVNPRSEDCTG